MPDPATDAPSPHDTEPDLEEQVEGLLSEVMETVEEIKSKLEDEPEPSDEIDTDTVIDDAGAAVSNETDEAEPTAPQSGVAAEPDEPAKTEEPEAVDPTAESHAEPAAEPESPEPESPEPESPEPGSVVEDVQSAIEEAIAAGDDEQDTGPEAETETIPPDSAEPGTDDSADTPENDVPDDELVANEPHSDESDPSDAAEVDPDTPEDQAGPTVSDYGDMDSLDDELAALASHALDEDLGDSLETSPSPSPSPAEPAAEAQDRDPAESTPPQPTTSEPIETPDTPVTEPESSEPETEIPASANPKPKPTSNPASLRWGWLPPKPEWDQVYSKLRPLIVAWRHTVWVTPPLVVFLWRWLLAHIIRSEPGVRHAVAVVAGPLSRREQRVRSAIGWLACWTAFWSISLWVYVLFARSPAVPVPTETPTVLSDEQPVAGRDIQP